MRKALGLLFAVISAFVMVEEAPGAETRKFGLELEFSPLWQSRNDARIPNGTGTQFSLRKIQGSGPFVGGRVFLSFAPSPKHELGFLVAPLSITKTGDLSSPILFAGKSFVSGPDVQATYTFNSYRMTYRYRIYSGDRWTWKLGITGKIRDAKIKLQDQTTAAENDDLGFVPLLHLDGERRLASKWKFHLNIDGLGAPQGRAIDLSLQAKYDISRSWTVALGYRTLEGGADVDSVYAFAWLHYATVSLGVRF